MSYDVRFVVDGHEFRRGFERKGWADTFATKLQEDFAAGCVFDPSARRFIPADGERAAGPSVYAFTREYVQRKWPTWQPSSRRENQRNLARAVRYLVDPAAPTLEGEKLIEADRFLRSCALILPESEPSVGDREWDEWFSNWSLALAAVTDGQLQGFLEHVRTTAVDGSSRVIGASTLDGVRRSIRAAFKSAQRRRLIDWNPWDGVEWKLPTGETDLRIELVMDPDQVLQLALACGNIDPRYFCFVLAQGVCGFRPGEAREIRRREVDLDGDPATLTAGGQHSDLPERFFMEGEKRRRPLKSRSSRVRRPVPIPPAIVPWFAEHMQHFVGRRPDALVFTTPRGSRINASNFSRDVWGPAKAALYDEGHPLREVRRHDLRHSAITAWLNNGVLLKTAQRWSGHRSLSVLLDTYMGVMKDDAAISLTRISSVYDQAAKSRPVTGW